MGRFFSFLLIAVAALICNSCTYVNTHRAIADRGRQFQAVILPDQENLDIFRYHGKLYVRGVLTTVRRAGRDKISQYSVNEFSSGQFIPVEIFGKAFELVVQSFSVLALIPIWLYKGKQGPYNKAIRYLYYGFYPAHLLIFALIRMFFL
jgi:hypothetical protein